MAIKEVTMFTAECDRCKTEAEFGDYTCYGDKDQVRMDCDAQGWVINDDDTCICDECKDLENDED